MTQNKFSKNTHLVARIGMMSAFSILLSFFPEIPMPFFASWLKLEFSFVPMLLTAFALGVLPGTAVLVIRCAFELLTTNSGGVGQLANLIMGLAMLLPAAIVYRMKHTQKGALIGMAAGIVAMTIAGVLSNLYILLPFYFGDGLAAYMESNPYLIWTAVVPFNLVKGAAVCLVTYILYKRLARFLKRGLRV